MPLLLYMHIFIIDCLLRGGGGGGGGSYKHCLLYIFYFELKIPLIPANIIFLSSLTFCSVVLSTKKLFVISGSGSKPLKKHFPKTSSSVKLTRKTSVFYHIVLLIKI